MKISPAFSGLHYTPNSEFFALGSGVRTPQFEEKIRLQGENLGNVHKNSLEPPLQKFVQPYAKVITF